MDGVYSKMQKHIFFSLEKSYIIIEENVENIK